VHVQGMPGWAAPASGERTSPASRRSWALRPAGGQRHHCERRGKEAGVPRSDHNRTSCPATQGFSRPDATVDGSGNKRGPHPESEHTRPRGRLPQPGRGPLPLYTAAPSPVPALCSRRIGSFQSPPPPEPGTVAQPTEGGHRDRHQHRVTATREGTCRKRYQSRESSTATGRGQAGSGRTFRAGDGTDLIRRA
jgi:hypothetical protein